MKASARLQNIAIPFIILLFAAVVRFYGIAWGLPQVYEEATPLTKAWDMWGWGRQNDFELNPHFFNYPSLAIYVQLLGQGFLYLIMSLLGTVDSTMDYQVLYILNKTPFYLLGRSITVLFSLATVFVTYDLGRRIMGKTMAIAVAFLLTINTVHISKSQVIEVDVPMTFFTILALWFFTRMMETPTKKNYIFSGLTVGLAVSTKYTAALLVFPLLVAHILARMKTSSIRHPKRTKSAQKPPWTLPVLALTAAVIAFFATSPFVFLDASTFLNHFSSEQQHMRMGHFGMDTTPTWLFYSKSFTKRLLGWPLSILALFGLVYLSSIRRQKWAIVSAVFVVPYIIAVASWSMRADRYLLPVLPAALIFAGGALAELFNIKRLSKVSPVLRTGAIVLVVLLLGAPLLASYSDHLKRLKPDTRTEAKKWVESKIPFGSFIVAEHYGPELFGASLFATLESDIRKKILDRKTEMPIYAVQRLPLLQVNPENSGIFYDLSLYGDADVVIISDWVKSRYLKEPNRFRRQLAFYDSLETCFHKMHELIPEDMIGPTITIYKNPKHKVPFGDRRVVQEPRAVSPSPGKVSRAEEFFYENLGFNYETFGYFKEALISYKLAFRYPITQPAKYKSLVLGRTRCLLALGNTDEAIECLRRGEKFAPTKAIREYFRRLRQRIMSRENSLS